MATREIGGAYDEMASGRAHLDTPRLVTDETNKVVWWNMPLSEPFGTSPPEEDPDGDGQNFTMNLRFPGQYADRETNTNYNYFRDYNPEIGRYVQSDPIGLQAGLNTYSYVNGNPLSYTDPLGLQVLPMSVPPPVGAPGQTGVGRPGQIIYPPGINPDPKPPRGTPTITFPEPPPSPLPQGPRGGCRAMFETCMRGANVCPSPVKQGVYGVCLAAFFACQAMGMGDGGPPGVP